MNFQNLNKIRYEAFKSQDQKLGDFDVTFVIDGKKLFANKFMIKPISTTFASMISDRWNSKNEPIPIDTYSYDDFYQFLTFLYSGECFLTHDNIFIMVDIAEFFQVADFKGFCDEFLTNLNCTVENIIQLFEIALKYSLDKLKKRLSCIVKMNRDKILNPDMYLQISKEVLLQILGSLFYSEDVFKKVYEWGEKHAMAKKECDAELNLTETIKEMLTDFLPLFDFAKMDGRFVVEFVVAKSLLPSGLELSSILLTTCFQSKSNMCEVIITDENGKVMEGQFPDPEKVYDEIQKLKNVRSLFYGYVLWKTSRNYRPSQNILKKRDRIEWYFIYDSTNDLAVKRRNQINDSHDYLIAEMFADDGFVLNEKCKIRAVFINLLFCYYN